MAIMNVNYIYVQRRPEALLLTFTTFESPPKTPPPAPMDTIFGPSQSPLRLSRLWSKKPERSKVGKSEEAPRPHR